MRGKVSLFGKVDDWLNPIVVKELRQAVRSKFVIAALILFLVIQLFTIGIHLMMSEGISSDFRGGQRVFYTLQSILVFTCLIFIPAYTGIRLNNERSGTSVDLLFATAIRPGAVIRGKFLAGVILCILIYSAFMPFMTFTYLLRGIDLPSVFLALAAGFLAVMVAIQVAIFLACVRAGLALKIFFAVVGLLFAMRYLFFILIYSVGVARGGVGAAAARSFWAPTSSALISVAACTGILYVLSVALISPASSNRMLPVRVYAVAMWMVTGAYVGFQLIRRPHYDLAVAWGDTMVLLFSIGLWIAASEREKPSVRVAATIPRPWLLRLVAFFLYTGAAGGVALSLVMIGLTIAGIYALRDFGLVSPGFGSGAHEEIWMMAGIALYAYCYAMTAVLIRRRLLANVLKPSQTYVLGLGLLAAGTLGPLLLAFFIHPDWASTGADQWGLWRVTNPFMLRESAFRPVCLTFLAIWASALALLSLPWFLRQVRAFRRPQPEPTSRTPEVDRE